MTRDLMELPPPRYKRVVVIGGGFGGIHVVKGLRGSPYQVVLIDRHNYHTFQPLLYQVASGGLEPDSIAYPLRKIFSGRRDFYFRMTGVERIEPENNRVITGAGTVAYDYLVLATGSTTNFFGMDDVARHGMTLKSVTDALDLRSLLLQRFEEANTSPGMRPGLLNIVVVGGGPTGVEVAGALAEFRNHVVANDYPELHAGQVGIFLVEAAGRLLGAFSTPSSASARRYLENMGVQVRTGLSVKGYDGSEVLFSDGTRVAAATLIWSAGVMGALPAGLKADAVARGQRIRTDAFCRVAGYDNVFAIGDVAALAGDAGYPSGHPMVAQVAIQQGALVAANLAGRVREREPKPFKYKDLGSLATVGRNKAVAEFRHVRLRGFIAWFTWMAVHLMSLVGFRNRLVVLVNWVWSYFSYDRAIRLIIRPYGQDNLTKNSG